MLLPFKLAPSSRLIRGTPPFRRMSTIAKTSVASTTAQVLVTPSKGPRPQFGTVDGPAIDTCHNSTCFSSASVEDLLEGLSKPYCLVGAAYYRSGWI